MIDLKKIFSWNKGKPFYSLVELQANDYETIKLLVENGIEGGAYEKRIAPNKEHLNALVRHMVSGLPGIDGYGRKIFNKGFGFYSSKDVYEKKLTNPEILGYVTFAYCLHKKEIEIWQLSILPEHRGKGIGGRFTDIILQYIDSEFKNTSVLARCHKDNSKEMQYILEKRNFVSNGSNKEGFNSLYRVKV